MKSRRIVDLDDERARVCDMLSSILILYMMGLRLNGVRKEGHENQDERITLTESSVYLVHRTTLYPVPLSQSFIVYLSESTQSESEMKRLEEEKLFASSLYS